MRILVDADACPVTWLVERLAMKYQLPVCLFCDTNHILRSEYSEIKVIGAGPDAVDFALVNACEGGDIVVTQDYGVAAMILAKGAIGIHQNGKWYTKENIDQLLMERHIAKEARRSSKRTHYNHQKKRTKSHDGKFEECLEKLIIKLREETLYREGTVFPNTTIS